MLIQFLLLVLTAGAPSAPVNEENRNAAAEWANQQLEDVFDAVMPSATAHAVQMPVCRVTTLRASGSLDTFEYLVRLVEPCPTVNPQGGLTRAAPNGEFMIADGSPIADQLARLRLEAPDISAEAAIPRIRIRRVELKPTDVRKLLAELSASNVSPMPNTDIALDAPTYEVTSATGMTARVIELSAASTGRGERRIINLAIRVADACGFDRNRLRYDASAWD